MPIFNNMLGGAAGAGGAAAVYEIERSLRFNSGDSAYLNRTPTNGSQTTATWSFWVKRVALGVETTLFGHGATSAADGMIQFNGADRLQVFWRKNSSAQVNYQTEQVFRDTSAWYHIVVRIDTTVATTVKIWINGSEVSDWAATPTNATVNDTLIFNNASYANYIGKWRGDTNPDTNAYLADVHFIEGQALSETDFGEYDDNGVWNPIRFTGSYGQGFTTSQATGALPIHNTTDSYGAVKGSGTRTDSSSSNIELAVAMDGTDGGTTFTDEHATIKGSGSAVALTAVGNVQTVTSQNKFYGSSASFDGSGDYLSFTNIDLQRSNFTYEAWVYATDTTKLLPTVIFTAGFNGGLLHSFGLANSSAAMNAVFGAATRPTSGNLWFQAPAITANKWTHIAWVRNGTTISIYVNGVGQTLDTTNGGNGGRDEVTNVSYIGSNDLNEDFSGYIQDARVYSTNKYTADFTVPGVSNGFHLDFSSNSSDAALGTDSSGNGNTWTVNNLTANRNEPYAHMWSGTFLSGEPGENAFDGNSNTAARPDSSQTITWTHPTGIAFTKLRIKAAQSGSGTTISVNGTNVSSSFSSNATVDLTSTITSPLTTISLTSTASDRPKLFFVEINDVILVSGHDTDVFIDSPTNYEADSGNNGGNYATLNPLALGDNITLSNGNLEASEASTSGHTWAKSNIGVKSGKWYVEITVNSATGPNAIGLTNYGDSHTGWIGADGSAVNGFNMIYNNGTTRQIFDGNVATTNYISGSQWTVGDIFQIAYDADNDKAWFGINNTWYQANGSSTTLSAVEAGTNATFTNFMYDSAYFFTTDHHDAAFTYNFGQRPFTYTVPNGFKSLCTQNLDAPEIAKPSSVFDVKLYTGNESTNPITSFDFSPDLVLRKGRYKPGAGGTPSGVTESIHWLAFDTVRTAGKRLILSNNSQEDTGSTTLTAFTSNGFTLGSSTDGNDDPQEYTAVCFDAGNAASPTSASAVYNKDQSWSGYMLTPNGGYANAKERAFNAQGNYTETNNSGETLDFNSVTGLTASTNVFVLPEDTASVSYTVTADIGGTTYTDSSVGQAGVTFNYTGNVTRITVRNNDSNSPTRLTHIKVDGKELIDTNITVTQPTLDSTYRTNTSAGFSIVSYTGNQTSGNNVAHGLNAKPAMIWVKTRDTAGGWFVYHEGLHDTAPEDYYLELNNNSGGIPGSPDASAWNRTQPTSSIFTIGNYESVNDQNGNMIAYLWSRVEGFSEFGHYIGNGSSDGPFIYTGFAPKFVLTRAVPTGSEWLIWDKAREPYNVKTRSMHMDAEAESGYGMDFLSNGFKTRVNSGSSSNNTNVRYLWVAFADNPFQQNGGIAV